MKAEMNKERVEKKGGKTWRIKTFLPRKAGKKGCGGLKKLRKLDSPGKAEKEGRRA